MKKLMFGGLFLALVNFQQMMMQLNWQNKVQRDKKAYVFKAMPIKEMNLFLQPYLWGMVCN